MAKDEIGACVSYVYRFVARTGIPRDGELSIQRMASLAYSIRCVTYDITQRKQKFSFYKIYIYHYHTKPYQSAGLFEIKPYKLLILLFILYCIATQRSNTSSVF